MRRLAEQKKTVEQWREMEKVVADLAELAHLTEEDESLQVEIQSETAKAESFSLLSAVNMIGAMLF